ncbi:MAG: LppX_LprAFG lipoprotein [Chloroflexota bacterium]|nr:LppX_LprAFG lipoprotein [Chloroflexota bacterium]MQG37961.1 LppX_LprAFG lipoprotein [SAR202 cluster bacterium]
MTVHIHHIPVTAAALFFLIALSCSNQTAGEEPTVSRVTPANAIHSSQMAMQKLNSFEFDLTHPEGFTTLSGSIDMTKAGGIVTSNGFDLIAEARIGRTFVRIAAIVIDDKTWMTNPLTGTWSPITPADSPFSFLDPIKLVADILGETQNARYAGSEQMNNELVVVGEIPATTLAALVGEVQAEAAPKISLTIDAESYLLKKIVITGITQPGDESNTVRVITLSNFNAKALLQPPI